MKFSVNWLREFVDLPKDAEEIVELLTRAGVETKNIETRGAKIDKVIVAQITASSRHPNADRLTVCEVDDASGTKRQIVCGATNYKVGDKVPLALPGAKLPNGLEIRKSQLRGVESEGMLCSPIELGLGQDAGGLLILSPEAKVGSPIADLFPSDTILDVEITPNRGDLLSHYGLAREITALVGTPLRGVGGIKFVGRFGETSLPSKGVKISATRECPFFSARKIDNVKVGPSPEWLRAKIESVGIRSIDNIVDISNFVMLELGQPTHAFDADKLKGGINVRLARNGEKFLALDGKTYSLTSENLVIADEERAIGIGGVMGGEETGVTEATRNVLLEAAYFLPASIRRTARNLNLPSDASYRFERGVDPGMILRASQRATELIREIADGQPAKEVAAAGKIPANPSDVSLSYHKCDQVLGLPIKPKVVDQILERFGLSKSKDTSKSENGRSTWKIPSYRRDLQRDVDLIEEVVRAHGVDKMSGTDRSRFTPSSAADRAYDRERDIRQKLAAKGFNEIRTSTLIPRRYKGFVNDMIEVRNPLVEEHVFLRAGLLPGLVRALELGLRTGERSIKLFELGKTFRQQDGAESQHLGILLCGNVDYERHWRSKSERTFDFFDLNGFVGALNVPKRIFRKVEHSDYGFAVAIITNGSEIGFAGQLNAQWKAEANAKAPVLLAEIDVAAISLAKSRRFREIERFPAITRDIAMIVREKISHEEILRAIENPKEPLLESVRLFDLFSGESSGLGTARKSLAYRLTYRDQSRTLTNEEVTAAHARIRERLQRELGAELRE
jgi:phenylalanyl-tRNA synthetase beta chain